MSKKKAPDNEWPPDRTIDPADPEPQFKDIDNQTDDEAEVHMAWLKRNFEALFEHGVECWFDDDNDKDATK